ncbi:MAG: hypothetical protein K2I20_04610 [Clostridia bacterium]|nr:hypothetical protein [Clostridia bacterium]
MKRNFKIKFLAVLLCSLFAFACAGCGYGSVIDNNGKPSGGNQGSTEQPEQPDNPNVPEKPEEGGKVKETDYTVTLFVDSAPYNFGTSSIQAEWINTTNKRKRFTATLDEKGFGNAGEIDEGDYYVHLINLPAEFTYNPNENIATPGSRKIYINLKRPLRPSTGSGTGWKNGECYVLRTLGTFRATIKSASKPVHYCYSPTQSGWYSITSWVDIFADNLKPVLKAYNGNAGGYVVPTPHTIISDGGKEGTYTKNFVYNVFVEPKLVGNPYYFTVEAEHKFNTYPSTVDFEIKYEGEVRDTTQWKVIRASQAAQSANSSLSYHYADSLAGNKTFSMEKIRYNPKTGCYHVYDLAKYPQGNSNFGKGFGPRIYCDIRNTTPCFTRASLYNARAIQTPVGKDEWLKITAQYVGVDYDEKRYDEDYEPNSGSTIFQQYLRDEDGTKTLNWDFGDFIQTDYASKANSHGRVYVTKELKIFLQLYAEAHMFWTDNYMSSSALEYSTPEGNGYFATQDAFWLFACGYYE